MVRTGIAAMRSGDAVEKQILKMPTTTFSESTYIDAETRCVCIVLQCYHTPQPGDWHAENSAVRMLVRLGNCETPGL